NFYNQGPQRKQELLNSCAVLGIPESRITIVDHKELPDDPKTEWSVSLVSSVIVKYIRVHSLNMVLTFDGRGVSGHANHVAIHKAVSHLACTGQVPDGIYTSFDWSYCSLGSRRERFRLNVTIISFFTWLYSNSFNPLLTGSLPALPDCCLLSLVTVGLFRKYISFLDLPLSWLLPSGLRCITGSRGYRRAKDAMFCHRTQLLWFRYLYIAFSRYMFINTFQIIPRGPKNLKIY
ncbi:hypothetical protein L3Q82_022075, partial [Scortum barcoo]